MTDLTEKIEKLEQFSSKVWPFQDMIHKADVLTLLAEAGEKIEGLMPNKSFGGSGAEHRRKAIVDILKILGKPNKEKAHD